MPRSKASGRRGSPRGRQIRTARKRASKPRKKSSRGRRRRMSAPRRFRSPMETLPTDILQEIQRKVGPIPTDSWLSRLSLASKQMKNKRLEGRQQGCKNIRHEDIPIDWLQTKTNLQGCMKNSETFERLMGTLQTTPVYVQELNLSDNFIESKDVAQIFKAFKGLTSIDVGYNYLNEEAALGIARIARVVNMHMDSLGLADCEIGQTGAKEIAEYLRDMIMLTSLDLSCNSIQDDGAIAICDSLKDNKPLKKLELASCDIGPTGAQAIGNALNEGMSKLSSINVGYNYLNEEAALGIVRAVKVHMTSLGLASCNIGPVGAKEIAKYLRGMIMLTSLDLSYNSIKDDGAIEICESLKDNKSMVSLGLASCNIGPVGAKEIAVYVQASAGLKELDLSNNFLRGVNIDDDDIGIPDSSGISAIAAALKTNNPVITSLDISNNQLGAEDGKTIAAALRLNTRLTSLDIRSNFLGREANDALRDAVNGRFELLLT